MRAYLLLGIAFLLLLFSCASREEVNRIENVDLRLERVAPHTFMHTSYLKSYNNFPCNGMVVINDNEAIVFDTPVDDKASEQLIIWIQNDLKCEIVAVVSTHFHIDCLGGLAAFHKAGIPSYGTHKTIALAKADSVPILPKNGFEDYLSMELGKQLVISEFMGEGHTTDNIVTYFPMDEVLFGGCLIKEIGAGKGNLADANTTDWPSTVKNVKDKYSIAKTVIPGHGKVGGPDLLDYTIELFTEK